MHIFRLKIHRKLTWAIFPGKIYFLVHCCSLCLTWLPVDGNINQSCLTTLLRKFPHVSLASSVVSLRLDMSSCTMFEYAQMRKWDYINFFSVCASHILLQKTCNSGTPAVETIITVSIFFTGPGAFITYKRANNELSSEQLLLCSTEEMKSSGFGTTWPWAKEFPFSAELLY